MKYKVLQSSTKYVGFLQLCDDMVCRCTLGIRKFNEIEKRESAHYSAHYSATLDENCSFILAREGDSEKLINAKAGDLIGIREIPPLRDLSLLAEGTHIQIRLLGTSYFRGDKSKPRHDIEIAVGE